jgi:hypothetical protein
MDEQSGIGRALWVQRMCRKRIVFTVSRAIVEATDIASCGPDQRPSAHIRQARASRRAENADQGQPSSEPKAGSQGGHQGQQGQHNKNR